MEGSVGIEPQDRTGRGAGLSGNAARWDQGNPTGDQPGTRTRARGDLPTPSRHLDVVST